MAGTYTKTIPYGDGDPISILDVGDAFVKFDVGNRSLKNVNDYNDPDSLFFENIYAPILNDDFEKYDTSRYLSFLNDENRELFGPMWGPKDGYVNSTCKIRAYYHDVLHNGLLYTIMYDFSGFLVGESLLMTTAHGLYRDVTVGEFDDGVDNVYIPGKIEVYGAIGLADDWGAAYPYYAKVTEIYFDSSYLMNPNFSDDWAICRLDAPLGKHLSYRKLNYDMMSDSSAYNNNSNGDSNDGPKENFIIGYPVNNQFHLRSKITDLSYLYTNNLYMYNCDSFDGMSGSPMYATNFREITNLNGDLRLKSRDAYGIHVGFDTNTQTGYAIRATSEMIYIINELNKIFEPESILINFGNVTATNGFVHEIYSIANEYNIDIELLNVTTNNGELMFLDGNQGYFLCSTRFAFDVPVTSFSFHMDVALLTTNSTLTMTNRDFYGNETTVTIFNPNISPSSYKVINFDEPVKSIEFTYHPYGGSGFKMYGVNVGFDWDFLVPSANSPVYDQNELAPFAPYENCVSYSFRPFISGYNDEQETDRGLRLGLHSNEDFYQSLDSYSAGVLYFLKKECNYFGYDLAAISKYECCSRGGYKVCILCDPYCYYHVLRQNIDGYWSQFICCEGVKNYDSKSNLIRNPEKSTFVMSVNEHSNQNGIHETDYDLSSFVGYFELFEMNL